jgi:chemotaxis protein methyltransferase CheR
MIFMKGMDLIFCCNVLIYFDGASKSKVINHFFSNLNYGFGGRCRWACCQRAW